MGQLDRARDAMKQALRTGTRDREILYHAAAIERASGNLTAARRLAAESIEGAPHFDVIAGPAAAALLQSLDQPSVARR